MALLSGVLGSRYSSCWDIKGVGFPEMTKENVVVERKRWGIRMAHRRSLPSATPDFLWTLMALADLMRLSLRERRTRGLV